MNNSKGFTLLELLFALMILLIMYLIAMPAMAQLIAYHRAQTNINSLQRTIIFARNHAISYGLRVTICPIEADKCSRDWHQPIHVFIDYQQANQIDRHDKILYQFPAIHHKDKIKYNRLAIRFQHTGLASGTNGTLSYCAIYGNKYIKKAIVINQSGRVRTSTKKNIKC
ncbi:GspH/FimT family pseudopilin [Shewanella marina]|uniref:GspH/FimT family pseudopilin n=1 Tax=Shewanella marina TaxID=487319 RepID=UPI000471DA48|nr:GspH/FimT family pseudopilin [Shewanella marina]